VNYYSDEKEWKWLFKNAIDWDKVLPLYYPEYPTEEGLESKEEVVQFLEELQTGVGEWCGTSLAERAPHLDEVGAGELKDGKTYPSEHLQATYDEAIELGVHGLSLPKKYDGMELPASMQICQQAFLARACTATMTQLAFFPSIADMILRYATEGHVFD
jgi:alkylation response protein AidB-like acyl-CoA dehydrogenase